MKHYVIQPAKIAEITKKALLTQHIFTVSFYRTETKHRVRLYTQI